MSVNEHELHISKSAINLYYNVSSKINLVKQFLSNNLFEDFIYDIATKIQDALFNNFILKQDFNKDAIKQFDIDLKQGLFAIFSIYIKNVQYTFTK